MDPREVLHHYIHAFVAGLAAGGLGQLVLAPGGRSAPVAILADRHAGIKVWRHVDERAAGYFALGMARATREPVALLCTSGTAAANFHPAVIEAYHARVPLVVMTADRPHELRDTGAPQTMDQGGLYGAQVKWSHELAAPAARPRLLRYAETTAARAVQVAAAAPAGPVHINLPLRKPLVPRAPASGDGGADKPLRAPSGPRLHQGRRRLAGPALDRLAQELRSCRQGLIICGMQEDPRFPAAVVRLAAALDLPVLADPLSGVRCGDHDLGRVVDTYDAMLRQTELVRQLRPDLVLRFGAPPVSQPLAAYLEHHAGAHRHLVVDEGDGWRDPLAVATDLLHAEPRQLCRALVERLSGSRPQSPPQPHSAPAAQTAAEAAAAAGPSAAGESLNWTELWLQAGRRSRQQMTQVLKAFAQPFEGRIVHELSELLPQDALLYVGNSMPVRDVDAFWPKSSRRLRIMANRGVNGIDGLVSSALGAAAVSARPVVLLVGDLSFYHDLNGLLAAHTHGLTLTVVLANNDGGGIFSFLPQAHEDGGEFERLFGTPTGLDFAAAVEGTFGGTFVRAHDWAAFRAAWGRSQQAEGLSVIEVATDRQQNVTMHEEVWAGVQQTLATVFQPDSEQARSEG